MKEIYLPENFKDPHFKDILSSEFEFEFKK
jgi:hypothetical protein